MKVLFTFISKQPLIKININCTHFLSTYFYSSFCSSFALCFLFLSFAFSFDIFSRKPSSFWHLYKLIYLLTQTSFVLRSTNRNLSLSAGQKQHTDGPVVFTALFHPFFFGNYIVQSCYRLGAIQVCILFFASHRVFQMFDGTILSIAKQTVATKLACFMYPWQNIHSIFFYLFTLRFRCTPNTILFVYTCWISTLQFLGTFLKSPSFNCCCQFYHPVLSMCFIIHYLSFDVKVMKHMC